jgi:hypothetical protein
MLKVIAITTVLAGICTISVIPSLDRSIPSLPLPFKIDRLETLSDPRNRNYISPRLNGEPVAFCRIGTSGCGKEAADAFCRDLGFGEARTYRRDRIEPDLTKLHFQQIRCWHPEITVDAQRRAWSPRQAMQPAPAAGCGPGPGQCATFRWKQETSALQ